MVPSLSAEQLRALRSRAESRFYEACEAQLPDDVVVIHSASWVYRDRQGRVREGEADFTILVPQSGVFAVEVKGGGITFDAQSGEWQSVDRSGQGNQIKDPFRQAASERYALLDQLTGHRSWRQWPGKRLTLGHAVVFPDINDSTQLQGTDRPRDIIGVNADLGDIVTWLDRVVRFWRSQEDDALGSRGVRLVENILCRSIAVRPALRSMVDDTEQQRLRLTANQAKILRILGGRKRAVISGGAGTGKTLLAAEKARQIANEGSGVLLLCYNRPLADALAASLQDEPRIVVMSFHQLCDSRVRQVQQATGRNLFEEAIEAYPGNTDAHRFNVQMPYALALSNELLEEKFDAIVIDEAQDFSDEYWFAIEELMSDPDAGYFYIFIDENQTLYPRHGNLPIAGEPYYLTENCRNTAPIHKAGYAFYSGKAIDVPDLQGPEVERIAVDTQDAQADAIIGQVRLWVQKEGVRSEDVAVLLATRLKESWYDLLQRRSQGTGIVWAVQNYARGKGVLLDTVARYKGLEAQGVVVLFADDVIEGQQWETVYVGKTRAKSLLCVVSSTKASKAIASK